MKLIKKMYAYNKYLTIYCGILIILAIITLTTIFGSASIGMEGYVQIIIMSIFFILLGVPLFLFMAFIFVIFCIELKNDVPTYFMKRKFKLKKNGKKELKSSLGILVLMLLPLSILGFMSWYGVASGLDAIKDYKYLEHPVSIDLYNTYVDRRTRGYVDRRTRGISSYWLYGQDYSGKAYKFRIGLYPDTVLPDNTDKMTVYYLPNNDIVMRVE